VVLVERVRFPVNRGVFFVRVGFCWFVRCGSVDALLCGSLFGRCLVGRVFVV